MDTTDRRTEVPRLFFEVGKILKQYMRRNFEDVGITAPQGMVIGALFKSGEMKITDLSKKVNLSNSTISGIIDRLEKQDLVVRIRSEEDRRAVYVKITPKVEKVYELIHRKTEESFEELLSGSTLEDITRIIEGLNTLKRILNQRKQ
jgi:DNA-binding MarR family transcriptional regulator